MSAHTSIDNQIARYVTHNFNAELEAQYIFKSYGENDISKQLNDMTTIQTSIETGEIESNLIELIHIWCDNGCFTTLLYHNFFHQIHECFMSLLYQ